ncbi:hypothetical protein ACLEUK_06175 [Pseudescherichia vulneris]
MSECVFHVPQRDEISFSIEDGYIVLSQADQLGNEPYSIRIHHLDADWIISGLNAAVEAAKKAE